MNNLNIFVSSTCYDLSQIRVDLSEYIKNSGHNSILSEFENFPISPNLSTVENCIKNVKENADILILIVGNRYGNIIENGKSITNAEFLTAKQKGIPVFCFIDKKTLGALNFWKDNKDANFDKIVDNTKIFDFVLEIRDDSKIWTFEFEKAQDIIGILKFQMSYLFKNSLKIKNIYEHNIPDYFKLNLSDKAIKILVDKSELYEFNFFAQTLVDEINQKQSIKNDFEYNLFYESKNFINDPLDITNWTQESTTSILNLIQSLSKLINNALPAFINEPGKPSDINGLYYVSRKYAEIFERIIKWKIDINSCHIDINYTYMKTSLANLVNNVIGQIWDFPFIIQDEINKATEQSLQEQPVTLNLILNIEIDPKDLEELNINIQRFGKNISRNN